MRTKNIWAHMHMYTNSFQWLKAYLTLLTSCIDITTSLISYRTLLTFWTISPLLIIDMQWNSKHEIAAAWEWWTCKLARKAKVQQVAQKVGNTLRHKKTGKIPRARDARRKQCLQEKKCQQECTELSILLLKYTIMFVQIYRSNVILFLNNFVLWHLY